MSNKEFKYEYESGLMDFHYEESGANCEELQHKDGCNWVYDNCTCVLVESLDYNVPDDGDW